MSPIADARSDDELLVAAAGGDADAFARFYERHIALVLSVLAQRTGSYELAADLAGETFAAALMGCRRFRPGGPPLRPGCWGSRRTSCVRALDTSAWSSKRASGSACRFSDSTTRTCSVSRSSRVITEGR